MPQLNYSHDELRLGQVASSVVTEVQSYLNPKLPQIGTFVASTFADGIRTFTFERQGDIFEVEVNLTGAGDVNAAAAAYEAALSADPDIADLIDFSVATDTVTYTVKESGAVYVVSVAGAGIAAAVTQEAGGVDVPIARGLVAIAGGPSIGTQHAALPSGASTDADFLGVSVRQDVDVELNDITRPNEAEATKPGQMLAAMSKGECVVRVEDACAFNGDVYMRIANPTAAAPLGGFRSDADGGDAILLSGVKYRSVTTGPGLIKIKLDRL